MTYELTQTHHLNKRDLPFGAPVFYPTCSGGYAVALEDVDNNGNLDMIAACNSESAVKLSFGYGNGTFTSWISYAMGGTPSALVLRDLDKDGDLDIVVAINSVGKVQVLSGNGDGTFATPATYTAGANPLGVSLEDVNNDSNLDIVMPYNSGNTIGVMLGYGNGTFAPNVNYGSITNPYAVALGDIDKDGDLDIAVSYGGSLGNSLSIMLGNGDGTFGTPTSYIGASTGTAVTVGDVNKDGNLDVVWGTNNNKIWVMLGNGNGSFSTPVSYVTGGIQSRNIVLVDINKDGNLDIVTANQTGNNVSVMLGCGDDSFGTPVVYDGGGNFIGPRTVALKDVNGDGELDIAVSNYGGSSSYAIAVLLGSPHNSTATLSGCSASSSASISTTPSSSVSFSVSVTPSGSLSVTPTASKTRTATVSRTVTPSMSKTISESATLSVTGSVSISSSITPTVSFTPSLSATTSITPSVTPTNSITATVTPSNNTGDALLVLVNNSFTVARLEQLVLTPDNLLATNANVSPSQIVFALSNVKGGYFELISNPGIAITSFTQEQINNGQVKFVQDGSFSAPTYNLSVSDGVSPPITGISSEQDTFICGSRLDKVTMQLKKVKNKACNRLNTGNLVTAGVTLAEDLSKVNFEVSQVKGGIFIDAKRCKKAKADTKGLTSINFKALLEGDIAFKIQGKSKKPPSFGIAMKDLCGTTSPALSVTATVGSKTKGKQRLVKRDIEDSSLDVPVANNLSLALVLGKLASDAIEAGKRWWQERNEVNEQIDLKDKQLLTERLAELRDEIRECLSEQGLEKWHRYSLEDLLEELSQANTKHLTAEAIADWEEELADIEEDYLNQQEQPQSMKQESQGAAFFRVAPQATLPEQARLPQPLVKGQLAA